MRRQPTAAERRIGLSPRPDQRQREVVHKVVLGKPDKAPLVDELVAQRRRHGTLRQERTQRLAFIKPEGGDVDQTDDIGCVCAECCHDLTTVGVPNEDSRAILEGQHLAEPGDIVRQRGHRELGSCDLVALGLELLDNGAPARAFGPCAVDKDDEQFGICLIPFSYSFSSLVRRR